MGLAFFGLLLLHVIFDSFVSLAVDFGFFVPLLLAVPPSSGCTSSFVMVPSCFIVASPVVFGCGKKMLLLRGSTPIWLLAVLYPSVWLDRIDKTYSRDVSPPQIHSPQIDLR